MLRPGNPKSSPIPVGPSRLNPLDDGRQPQNQPEHYRPSLAQTSSLPIPTSARQESHFQLLQ